MRRIRDQLVIKLLEAAGWAIVLLVAGVSVAAALGWIEL